MEQANLGPGDEHRRGPLNVSVHPPVDLPGPLSLEPSMAVGRDGTVAVAAPAGTSNPKLFPYGGFLWVSRDAGSSYELVLNPKEPVEAGFCSCDTDVAIHEGEILATTMYWSVRPLFNANLVASSDGGRSWETRSISAAEHQPIDRPWIETAKDGTIFLAYDQGITARGLVTGDPDPIYLQRSEDGGRSWTSGRPVIEDRRERTLVMDPVTLGERTVLVPLATQLPGGKAVTRVAVNHDRGTSFDVVNLSQPHHVHAAFHLSLDAAPDGSVLAAWSYPVEGKTQKLRYRMSHDQGDTWRPARTVDLPGSFAQPWVAARGDGLVAIAYHWSPEEGSVFGMDDETPWRPRLTLFDRGQTLTPVASVNLSSAPTFHGVLCNFPTSCPKNVSHQTPMREFLSTTWSPDGSALYTAWTDAREQPSSGETQGRITVTKLTFAGDVDPATEQSAADLEPSETSEIPPIGTRDPPDRESHGPN